MSLAMTTAIKTADYLTDATKTKKIEKSVY